MSASGAAVLLSATTVVATLLPTGGSEPATQLLTAAIGRPSSSATDAVVAGAVARAEERTSRRRSSPATALTPSVSQTPDATDAGAAGPGRAPAATSADKLATSAAAGVSGAACPISGSIESHLTANARGVYRAVCAAFPGVVSSYGGYRAGSPGDHGTGRAVDIMVSGDPGLAIAAYVQAHAAALHVTYVIYQQKIWLVGDPTSQWKAMEDRGSRTANHYDHVHVSVS